MKQKLESSKCAVIVADTLPTGLAANAASVISMTLGRSASELLGPDVADASGVVHGGIVQIPLPILTAASDRVQTICLEAKADPNLVSIGFTSLAQSCHSYGEYIEKMSAVPTGELKFVAVGLFGPKRSINRLAGNLPLLR